MAGVANSKGTVELGGGARFWVYLSPQNNTAKVMGSWSVTFSQGNWSDTITSEDPTKQIQTPGLSGEFNVKVTQTVGSTNPPSQMEVAPLPPSRDVIGCNSNCASMVGLIADEKPNIGGTTGKFWTTWDALCS